ncbi:hypothetical protein STSP2_01522 [Anaerohalosphaera lusitana]|uniref:Uncharacterized protein n=1 Tax=Anaerohalosphaera lusitana TaxID=1936003 RepID=A0A1U9NKB2_9BACT|nr:hypothetical protein [Anaerohalosphaera lusitana]AQT68362.1 hypothetical protein STSP2_01522 [Anaerohalosphaera lusitana]
MPKVKIDKNLYKRAEEAAQAEGYSSVDELVIHLIELAVAKSEGGDNADAVEEQLRGLGYIE